MPLNILKVYNQLLDLGGFNEHQRRQSLMGVFNRDFTNNPNLNFRRNQITPTPADGEIPMETLFTHLTTADSNEGTRHREFDLHRSVRLHWIKYHFNERKVDNMLIFSVHEPEGNRTYIYDKDEMYVIVLEPLRNGESYYLLTAFQVRGKDAQRDKYGRKYRRRLDVLL